MNPMQVSAETRIPATLTAAEWDCLFNYAQASLPSITLQLRSQLQGHFLEQARAQAQQQAAQQEKQPAAEAPAQKHRPATADEARAYLDVAEGHRRVGDGTLNLRLIGVETEDVEYDYAVSTLIISRAMQHLDESLPNGQLVRSTCAFLALEYGTAQLRAWLERRSAL